MKNIVVPTDFSQNALNAVLVAYALAARTDARCTVIHCYRQFRSAFQPSQANEQDSSRIRIEAEDQMKQLQIQLQNLNLDTSSVKFVCVAGDLPNVLDDLGREKPIDLVVMGTTGASGVKYHFLGSNTFDIARQAKFPLLVVPIGVSQFDLEHIAFLTDFQPKDRLTLANLLETFGQDDIDYHLVHIVEEDTTKTSAYQKKLEDWAEQLRDATGLTGLKTQLINEKENIEAVTKLAEQKNTDLLALTMAERSFWDLIRDKSLARAIIMQSKVPIFVTN